MRNPSNPSSKPLDVDTLLASARQAVTSRRALDALRTLEVAHELSPDHPVVCSLLGVLLAEQRGLIKRAEELCRKALEARPRSGEFHMNLARVLVAGQEKSQAVEVLRQGMASVDDPAPLKKLLDGLGLRRRPAFTALPRSHPLNKWVGLVTFRLGVR